MYVSVGDLAHRTMYSCGAAIKIGTISGVTCRSHTDGTGYCEWYSSLLSGVALLHLTSGGRSLT